MTSTPGWRKNRLGVFVLAIVGLCCSKESLRDDTSTANRETSKGTQGVAPESVAINDSPVPVQPLPYSLIRHWRNCFAMNTSGLGGFDVYEVRSGAGVGKKVTARHFDDSFSVGVGTGNWSIARLQLHQPSEPSSSGRWHNICARDWVSVEGEIVEVQASFDNESDAQSAFKNL